jgi:hypothetical protein
MNLAMSWRGSAQSVGEPFGLPDVGTWLSATIVTILGFGLALPASFAVAILRYRLYDLDLLLNRTLVYGAVHVVLAAGFGIADVLAQRGWNRSSISGRTWRLAASGWPRRLPLARCDWIRPIVDRFLPARSRLTLLLTDIVGSTQAIVDLGDERCRAVLGRFRAAMTVGSTPSRVSLASGSSSPSSRRGNLGKPQPTVIR